MNDHDESDDVLKEGVSSALIPARERTFVRHLPFFAVVAEEGHFGRAAVRLGISQSALTRRVQALEKDIGVTLFMRDQRTPQLTRAGEVLLEETAEILHAVSASVRKARRAARGEIGHLRIAHTEQSLRVGRIKTSLDSIRKQYPGIKIEHAIMPSEAQIVALGKEELDLGFLYDVVLASGVRFEINTMEIARFPAALAVHRDHPLARKPEIRLADLNGVPMTWPSTRSGRSTGDALFAEFRSHGLLPTVALEVMSDDMTLLIAEAGLGVGLVLDREADRVPAEVVLRPIADLTHRLNLQAVWRRDTRNPVVERVVAELSAHR